MTASLSSEESQARSSKKPRVHPENEGEGESGADAAASGIPTDSAPSSRSSPVPVPPPAPPAGEPADDFLASMTFAFPPAPRRGCEGCDECGSCGPGAQGGREGRAGGLPPAIAAALDRYREGRRRRAGPGQSRTLRRRHGPCSVWEWNLPSGAASGSVLLELGNSHRLVWVQRRPGMIQSLGAGGVVGSHGEESTRADLADWEAGSVVFVPSNGGRAVGYVHRNLDEATTGPESEAVGADSGGSEKNLSANAPSAAGAGGRYATLLIAKIPDRLVAHSDGSEDESRDYKGGDGPSHPQMPHPSWLEPLLQICRRLLVSGKGRGGQPPEASESPGRDAPKPFSYTVLDADDAAAVKSALS